jgi:hypothetical protein
MNARARAHVAQGQQQEYGAWYGIREANEHLTCGNGIELIRKPNPTQNKEQKVYFFEIPCHSVNAANHIHCIGVAWYLRAF